jgi:hypothetical protein
VKEHLGFHFYFLLVCLFACCARWVLILNGACCVMFYFLCVHFRWCWCFLVVALMAISQRQAWVRDKRCGCSRTRGS